MIEDKDFKTRAKRDSSHPFKMLASFADAKAQHPANPELKYVYVDGASYVASDGYRALWIEADSSIDESRFVPVDFFTKLKGNKDVPLLLAQWLESVSYVVPDGCDVSRFPPTDFMEEAPASSFHVHRLRMMDRLELAMTTDKSGRVEMEVLDGAIRFLVVSGDIVSRTEIGLEVNQPGLRPFVTRVNGKYLKQALDVFEEDSVEIKLFDSHGVYALVIHGANPEKIKAAVALARDEVADPFADDDD